MMSLDARLVLLPILAMVLLTAMVAGLMFRRRVSAMKSGRIHPQKVALAAQMSTMITDTRAADNFRNLFETPVLFYVALLTIHGANLASLAYLLFAWAYVAARYVHSYVQCGPNRVMHRFYAFATSCLLLLAIWLLIAIDLFFPGRA
jgi:hypothetical protein